MEPVIQDSQSTSEASQQDYVPQDKHGLSKKKKIVLAAVAVLIAGLVVGLMLGSNNTRTTENTETTPQGNDDFAQQYLRGCNKDRTVTFTHSPIALEQLGYIEPMGKMSDGHVTPTDHVYIAPKDPSAADNTTNVVMPADGTVIGVSAMPAQYIGDKNQQTAPEDHRIIVAHNCQYVSIFIHVHRLSDTLRTALGGTIQPNTQKELDLDVKAGDVLGSIGGNPVDWSLMDATKTVGGFITPDLYKGEPWKVHVIDPLSIYIGSLKDQLIAKSLRNSQPYGGKIDYDQKGALVGNWFRENTNGYMGADQQRYWDGHLAVVPNHIDPAATMVSVGNWQGKAAQFAVKGKVDPAAITSANGITKYELTDVSYVTPTGQDWVGREYAKGLTVRQSEQVKGVALFQVMAGEKVKVEFFPNKTAAQVTEFTPAAHIYAR